MASRFELSTLAGRVGTMEEEHGEMRACLENFIVSVGGMVEDLEDAAAAKRHGEERAVFLPRSDLKCVRDDLRRAERFFARLEARERQGRPPRRKKARRG